MSVNVGSAIGYMDLDTSRFRNGLQVATSQLREFTNSNNSAGDRVSSLGGALKTAGSTMTKTFTVPLAAVGVASVKTAADFQSSMNQVAATMGITADEIAKGSKEYEALSNAAKETGATTQFSASQSAEALNYLALAGYDTTKAIETLPTVLNLAAAGGMELGAASDMVTDAMSALGDSAGTADNFVDKLAKTSQKSNTSVSQLGEGILTVGGTAKVLSGGVTEMNTVLGIFADNGIKGSEGGTALRNVILSLSAPTDKAAAALKSIGVEAFDSDGKMRPLNETFKDLDSKLSTMSDQKKTQVLNEIFNKVDLKSVNALLANSGERFDELSGYIDDADGAAANMAETMNLGLNGALTQMKSALEGVGIAIGDRLAPAIQSIAEWITDLLTWFNELDPAMQDMIVVIGLIVAAVGPLLMIFGQMAIGLGALITLFSAGGAGAVALSAAFTFITGPVGAVIAIIGALIAVGVALYKNWDQIKADATRIWESLKTKFSEWIEGIKTSIQDGFEQAKEKVTETWDNLVTSFNEWTQNIKQTIQDKFNEAKDKVIEIFTNIGLFFTETIPQWITNITNWFNELPYKIGYALGQLLGNVVLWGVETWNYFSTNVPLWIESISTWFSELPGKIWTWLTEIINNIKEWGTNVYNIAKDKVETTINAVVQYFSELPGKIWTWLTNAIQKIIDWGQQIYEKAKTAVNNTINAVVQYFSQLPGKVWTWLNNTIQNMLQWGSQMVEKGRQAASNTVTAVVNGITSLPGKVLTIGKNAVSSLWEGISSMGSWIKGKISGFISGLVGGFSSITGKIKGALGLGKSIPMPPIDMPENPGSYGENDLSNVQFSYTKARTLDMGDMIKEQFKKNESLNRFNKSAADDRTEVSSSSNDYSRETNIHLNISEMVIKDDRDIEQIGQEIAYIVDRVNKV